MKMRPVLLAPMLALALWACQGDLYPTAPDTPERVTIGSPDPGSTPGTTVPQRGLYGGQLQPSGSHYLEFLGFTPPRGSYTLYLFPWDADMHAIPFASGAQAKLKLSNGQQIAMTAATNQEDGSLFFYAFPEASFERLNVTLQAEVSLAGTLLTGSFVHPDR
jgi:hypothetical protein